MESQVLSWLRLLKTERLLDASDAILALAALVAIIVQQGQLRKLRHDIEDLKKRLP